MGESVLENLADIRCANCTGTGKTVCHTCNGVGFTLMPYQEIDLFVGEWVGTANQDTICLKLYINRNFDAEFFIRGKPQRYSGIYDFIESSGELSLFCLEEDLIFRYIIKDVEENSFSATSTESGVSFAVMRKVQDQVNPIPSQKNQFLRLVQIQKELLMLTEEAYALNITEFMRKRALFDRIVSLAKENVRILLFYNKQYRIVTSPRDTIKALIGNLQILADCLEGLGEAPLAKELRIEMLSLSKKYLTLSEFKIEETRLANTLLQEGRFNESLTILTNNKNFFEKNGELLNLIETMQRLTSVLTWLGDYERALSEIQSAEKTISPLLEGRAISKNDIDAALAESMANIDSGITPDNKVGLIAKLHSFSLGLISGKALILDRLERFEEEEALITKIIPEFPGPITEGHFAKILIRKGLYQEGLERAIKLEPQFLVDADLRPKFSFLMKLQADALQSLHRYDEALDKLAAGIRDLNTDYYDPDLLWQILLQQGIIFETTGNVEKALRAYSDAVFVINDLRKAPLGYRLDSLYLKDKLPLFDTIIDLTCRKNLAEQCCKFIEMIKSRTLTATLSVPHNPKSDNESKKEFYELSKRLDGIEHQAYEKGLTEELRKEKKSLQGKRADLIEKMRFSDPRWHVMTEPTPFDLEKIAKVLAAKKYAALNLFYRECKIIAVLIKDGKCSTHLIKIAPETNDKLLKYQQNLQNSKPDPKLYDISEGLAVTAENLITSEILKTATDSNGLIIIPHGILHLIPWGGLHFGNKRLFEYCPIGILPNLSCILSLNSAVSTKPKIALIGSPDYSKTPRLQPLYGAAAEIDEVQKMYRGGNGIISSPFIEKQATEENFWKLLGNEDAVGGILHIACHGNSDPEDPTSSGLIFSDSKVDAAEISQSSVRYDEVILSACNTGWRPTQVEHIELLGDDILGLPGSFLEAGAKSVLVSIPQAADETTLEFMTVYHKNRIAGKTPLAALQETQKNMLSNNYPIYHWIGFTVYGCQ